MSVATKWTRLGDGPAPGQGEYRCECGTQRVLSDKCQRSKRPSIGCGCHLRPIFRHRPTTTGQGGLENMPEYISWRAMRRRCADPNRRCYHRYGGRGIKVCDRWQDFSAFYEDMGPRPVGHTLDRIDNDGDYEPTNCRWASVVAQNENRINNRPLTFEGRTLCVTAWARELGVKPALLFSRIRDGWSTEDALTKPSQGYRGRPAGYRVAKKVG